MEIFRKSIKKNDESISAPTSASISMTLYDLCSRCDGLSGRALRKLPFLAYALFSKDETMDIIEYLDCLSRAIEHEFGQRDLIEKMGNDKSVKQHTTDEMM